MLQLLLAEPYQRLERMLVAKPVVVAQLQHLGVDEPLHEPEHVGIGTPWIWLTNRFSVGDSVVNSWDKASPSGRNLCAVSNRRPRMTSASTSQCTRLDASTDRAYRWLSGSVTMAVMFGLLCSGADRMDEPAGRCGQQ